MHSRHNTADTFFAGVALFSFFFLIFLYPAESESKVSEKSEDPLKVGVLLPLSGPLAEMGLAVRRGIELFQHDYTNFSTRFVFEDHKYDGKSAVTALHSLKARSDIGLVIVWGNTPSSAVSPVSEQQKIPTLAISMNPDGRGRKSVVSLGPPLHKTVDAFASQLLSLNSKIAAAVTVDIGNAIEAVDSLSNKISGGLLKRVVAAEEGDFKPLIAQLKKQNTDSVVLFLLPQQALTFLRQAGQLNFHPNVIGGDVFANEDFRKKAINLSSKISIVYGAVMEPFIDRLRKSEGGVSYFFEVAVGYSAAILASQLLDSWRLLGRDGSDPFVSIGRLRPSGLPLEDFVFSDNQNFGRHFEIGMKSYRLDSASSKFPS